MQGRVTVLVLPIQEGAPAQRVSMGLGQLRFEDRLQNLDGLPLGALAARARAPAASPASRAPPDAGAEGPPADEEEGIEAWVGCHRGRLVVEAGAVEVLHPLLGGRPHHAFPTHRSEEEASELRVGAGPTGRSQAAAGEMNRRGAEASPRLGLAQQPPQHADVCVRDRHEQRRLPLVNSERRENQRIIFRRVHAPPEDVFCPSLNFIYIRRFWRISFYLG